MSLQGTTLFITGGSRGIGLAIALRAAEDGANIVIAAKSDQPHPKLEGTIHTAAEQINALGGQALPIMMDVRQESQVQAAMQQAAERFGGIDVLINNAGAIQLSATAKTAIKRYDLMQQINSRAVLLCAQTAYPYFKEAEHGRILNLSPPLNFDSPHFSQFLPYALTKYGMSMLTLGLSKEWAGQGITVNSLWPRTMIATAAVQAIGGPAAMAMSRTPAIMADAAYHILTAGPDLTGELLIDEDFLRACGIEDFDEYAIDPAKKLGVDLFVE